MNKYLRSLMVVVATFSLFASAHSQASVVIGGTRMVYPADDREITVKLTNEGSRPALVQVWLDQGDETSTPDTADVPFTVSPPIFRWVDHAGTTDDDTCLAGCTGEERQRGNAQQQTT